ncbi:MAG: phenylalanine--tRNA ligase subunit beta [bacterium]|nr:phenylalanine--tRNA ligase subunit beta [bacterium]
MNIKILDSWLKEYLKTKASAQKIAKDLSLTSVSVEKVENFGNNDFVYDIEVTTNRPDLMSVIGIAREGSAILPQFHIQADLLSLKVKKPEKPKEILPIKIESDPSLVNRITAIVMEVTVKESPKYIKERLEASGIRTLNNLIDITNYVMREVGHPTHVFDYDRLTQKTLIIRQSKKGEKIVTLDGKEHILQDGDIVADDGTGQIVDLLGVMGTENSVVTNQSKRILFFLDNNDPNRIRKTSMSLGIRSEAAILNEKGVDPELAMPALLRGIELFKEIADGKVVSDIIDIYSNKPKIRTIKVSKEKVSKVVGVEIPEKISVNILEKLGFEVKTTKDQFIIIVPSWRSDVEIDEDIIEEIARVYGYYKLPSIIPPLTSLEYYHMEKDPFYFEKRVKEALKYWGFTENYTYSMVSENLLEGPVEDAVTIANPLTEDMVYLRKTLVPSLLQIARNNENREELKIFELSNVYFPKADNLPSEILMLAGVLKKNKVSFYEIKGIVEHLLTDLGIKDLEFSTSDKGGFKIDVFVENDFIGNIEVLDQNIADFELNFEKILKYASLKKVYKPIPKFPPIIEDIRVTLSDNVSYKQIVSLIKKQSDLISEVNLLDIYENKKTFRIRYQDPKKTLTNEEVSKIREKIISLLQKNLSAKIV